MLTVNEEKSKQNEKLTLMTLKMVDSDIDHKDDYDISVIMRRLCVCVDIISISLHA